MAPELYHYVPGLGTTKFTNAIDIWALGCIVYRIMARAVPFPDLFLLNEYAQGRMELLFKVAPPMVGAEAFVRELLAPHPAKRPSASAGLENSWVISSECRLNLSHLLNTGG